MSNILINNKFIEILKKEVVPAFGCTEPVAVAYAAAKATEVLGVLPDKVELTLSGNVIKNAMSVGIPGTGMKGVNIATAVGVYAGKSSKGLEVLNNISEEDILHSKELLKEGFITTHLSTEPNKLYIKVNVSKGSESAVVEIKDFHTAISSIEKNGVSLLKTNCDNGTILNSVNDEDRSFMTVNSIYDFSMNIPLADLYFLKDIIVLNEAIAKEGLINDYGLKVGKTRISHMSNGVLGDSLESYAIGLTAAATDARMAGSTMAVMTNSGSGNQGITATVPVIAAAAKLNSTEEELLRALALSSLVAIHMKNHLGRLSALCGCVVASTGSSCAISYLMGGKLPEIEGTIKNVLGNITGMFCDGAKPGCSLKVATGVSAGIQAALLANDKIIIGGDEGIIDKSVEQTIVNACSIGRDAMNETDKMILDIMVKKNI
ncbi:MAG: serine dehydratase subunit alpha family protein [Fusobacteriaceae bacterium]